MRQMGERKQPSPDLFIAQKTIAFTLCLYNPCFPASASDPDKGNTTNKMPVGGPLTPRANCTGVRDSTVSGLSPPFVQGARGKPTGQGEEQNHGRNSGNHPGAWAAETCTHPRWSPVRPGWSSATCRNVATRHGAAQAPPNSSPLGWDHAKEEPGPSGPPDTRHTMCPGGSGGLQTRSWRDRVGPLLVQLCPPSLPPHGSSECLSTGAILKTTERRDEESLSSRREGWLVSFGRRGGQQPAGLREEWRELHLKPAHRVFATTLREPCFWRHFFPAE